MSRAPRQAAALALRAAVALLALAGRARAEGFAALAEPSFSRVETRATDASGALTDTDTTGLVQRYRGSFDRSFFPQLRLGADGLYEWSQAWNGAADGTTKLDGRRWSLGSRLSVGGPVLGGGASWDRREESTEQRLGPTTLRSPTLVRETLGAFASWRPADLPSIDLHAGRSHSYDAAGQLADLVADDVTLGSIYRPAAGWELDYSARYAGVEDRLHGVDTTGVTQTGRAVWSDTALGGRLTTYVSYAVSADSSRTIATRAGGTVLTQAFPVGGLSGIESFPDLPGHVKLAANPALLDGDSTAAAGLNLGFSATAAGDTRPRDAGAEFALATLRGPVNVVYVWVDQALPQNVSTAIAWTAWRSDDNQDWVELGVGSAQFSPFQNRFELAIEAIAARYVKVTARPLPATVTTDPRFATIQVTELQFFTSEAAAEVAAREPVIRVSGQLNGSGRLVLLREPTLVWDAALLVAHVDHPWRLTWSAVNGLSLARRLGRAVQATVRVERTDLDGGGGHEGDLRWSASLVAEPIPTLGAGVSYSGEYSDRLAGTTTGHAATAFGRADLYQGLSVLGSAGATLSATGSLETRGLTASAGTSVTPNRAIALTGSYTVARTVTSGGAGGDAVDRRTSLDGTVSVSPFPALYAAASVNRVTSSATTPSTLATFTAGFSPFPGGNLVVRFTYSESLNTAGDQRLRVWGPGLRWNVRPGLWTDVNYTVTELRSAAQIVESRSLFASLSLALR